MAQLLRRGIMFLFGVLFMPRALLADRLSRSLVCLVISVGGSYSAMAAESTSTWLSSSSGLWTDIANWDTSFFPDAGNGGFSTHDAVIDATGLPYAITLDTDVELESLFLNSSDARITSDGARSVSITDTAHIDGIFELQGGTIDGGDWIGSGQLVFADSSDVIGGATLHTAFEVVNRDRVTFDASSSFTGEAILSGLQSTVSLSNGLLEDATVKLDNLGAVLEFNNEIFTIAASTTIQGRGGLRHSSGAGTQTATLINQGTISAAEAGNSGLDVFVSNFSNEGIVKAINGSTIELRSIFGTTNTSLGVIRALDSSTVIFSRDWSSAGSISVDETSRLELGGSFDTSSARTIDNTAGGTVSITGDWNNQGQSFTFNATTGSWWFNGGTIRGGDIFTSSGGELVFSGASPFGNRFSDGATFHGDVHVVGRAEFGEGGDFTGDAYLQGSAELQLDNPFFDNRTIHMDAADATLIVDGDTALTLGAATVVRGQGLIDQDGDAFVNDGLIHADVGGNLALFTFDFTNNGVLRAEAGSTLTIGATSSSGGWTNHGMIEVDATSTLRLGGTFTLQDLGTTSYFPTSQLHVVGLLRSPRQRVGPAVT